MRKIAVVTVGRSDYGLYRPILRRIQADRRMTLQLIAAGAHFSAKFGRSERDIQADGFQYEAVHLPDHTNTPREVSQAMGYATAGFAESYERLQPEILLLLGDRFEMHAAAVAAVPFRIPIAHIHGGELTFGAMDDAFRHSITKLAHLHFTATPEYRQRVIQMGEEAWRVTVSGAPGLDNIAGLELCTRDDFASRHSVALPEAPILVTYHPETLASLAPAAQIRELLVALETIRRPILFTLPNADQGHEEIISAIRSFIDARTDAFAVSNLGTRDYFSAMGFSAAMVGNSSSGMIEAASFRLPVVNIGRRQDGRMRPRNVIDAPCERSLIGAAIERAISPQFREPLADLENPYGTGHASEVIAERLASVPLDEKLLIKIFQDLPEAA